MPLFNTVTATIAAGQSLSPEVDLGQLTLCGIVLPNSPAWTAAALTFQVSADGGATWVEHYSPAGTETTFTVANGQYVAVDPTLWKGVYSVKVRSGTSGTPVVQTNSVPLTLVVRSVLA